MGSKGKVVFEHGEDVKSVELDVINEHSTKKDLNFQV